MASDLSAPFAALMLLTSVASVSGNLLLLILLLLHRELRTETLGLTLSFSLSDLALGLSTIPFGVHNSLAEPDGYPGTGALCQGSGFIFLLLQTSSIHSLTWATIDKFTEICFALSYRRLWTAARVRSVLVTLWGFSLLNATLPLLGIGSYVYSESRYLCCLDFRPENQMFVVLWMVVGIVAPIITMCSLYGYIVFVARKQARRGTFMCNELHCFYVPANNYLRSSVVMVTTSVCLLVCWMPYISVCLYETFSGSPSPPVSSALSAWLVLTSSALNPWITCMTQMYRLAVRRSAAQFLQVCCYFQKTTESHPQSTGIPLHSAHQISTATTGMTTATTTGTTAATTTTGTTIATETTTATTGTTTATTGTTTATTTGTAAVPHQQSSPKTPPAPIEL